MFQGHMGLRAKDPPFQARLEKTCINEQFNINHYEKGTRPILQKRYFINKSKHGTQKTRVDTRSAFP